MTKTLFRVICTNAIGARNPDNADLGLVQGTLYDVVADVHAATTERKPDGDASGYLLRNADTGTVLPQLYRRDRFVKEGEANAPTSAHSRVDAGVASTSVDVNPASTQGKLGVGDVVICVDAVGARSFSKPETMLEQDEEYRIVADLTDAVTVRKPEGGSSGFVVQRTEDDAMLAGVWNRRRFERA